MSWPLGHFGYDPSRKEPGKRLEYITQNGIMSMASHGLSQQGYLARKAGSPRYDSGRGRLGCWRTRQTLEPLVSPSAVRSFRFFELPT